MPLETKDINLRRFFWLYHISRKKDISKLSISLIAPLTGIHTRCVVNEPMAGIVFVMQMEDPPQRGGGLTPRQTDRIG